MSYSKAFWKKVQTRLRDLGYYHRRIDGIPGSNTKLGLRRFQHDRQLLRSQGGPLRFPGTLGPTTIKALGLSVPADPSAPVAGEPPWMTIARSYLGLHERTHNSRLRRFLRSDRRTLGDPARLPWCGDFVETAIRLALEDEPFPGRLGENPYLARNWMEFGQPCELTTGAVVVFWRGRRNGLSGHVGFVSGQAPGRIYTLGGNQSNRVSIAPLSADRVLGFRWPLTVAPPSEVGADRMYGGSLSTNEA
ncbi:MAG: TIGR02594 family protein [Bacteroidota bacterium]